MPQLSIVVPTFNEAGNVTELRDRVAAALPGALVIDVPQGRTHMAASLQAAGFTPERAFARMVCSAGRALAPARTAIVQAVAGPEYA